MDSPHLLHLGFLLLALAASHPNIAMSTVGPAEVTEDSSSDKTTVTVYYCKDCDISKCSFEYCDIIAETQNKIFSNVTTELVTNQTHITVCFEQANSCLEGIYGVFWKNAEGAGTSCAILNFGENGRGNNSTEKNTCNICCEAETNAWRGNPTLKCYTQKSHPKSITLPISIGNPELLTSKNNSIGLWFAFMAAAVCTGGTIVCYLRRRRRRQALRHDKQLIGSSTSV